MEHRQGLRLEVHNPHIETQNFDDYHHIFHAQRVWEVYDVAKYLRERPEFVPLIPRLAHNELHDLNSVVPLPSYQFLASLKRIYEPVPDTLMAMDSMMTAIELAAKHRKAKRNEKFIAEAMIESLYGQRVALRGNIIMPQNLQ